MKNDQSIWKQAVELALQADCAIAAAMMTLATAIDNFIRTGDSRPVHVRTAD